MWLLFNVLALVAVVDAAEEDRCEAEAAIMTDRELDVECWGIYRLFRSLFGCGLLVLDSCLNLRMIE